MAHEIDVSKGFAAFAEVRSRGQKAWRGLGQVIEPGDSLATIAKKAGLNWSVLSAPVRFTDDDGNEQEVRDCKVNFRADTKAPLGVVSASRYNVVQPNEVLEFFRDFLADNKLSIETAGAVRGGRIIWCLAKLGKQYDFLLPGKDKIDGYVRLQTTFDGTRATDLVATTIRQVCANTMRMVDAVADRDGYRVPHSSVFDARALQSAFGLIDAQHRVTAQLWNALVERKVTIEERRKFFCDLLGFEVADLDKSEDGKPVISSRTRNMLGELEAAFANGPGAALKSSKDTAFGLLQAVTYWTDHKAGAIDKHGDGKDRARLTSAWFGLGERTKADAEYLAAQLAGCTELVAA
jgi:phage/plasmid-like protein (TIGR03299 family)